MYYPYFIAYMSIGMVLSLPVFFWALRNGQFRDQQRARFLPLRGDTDTAPAGVSRLSRLHVYSLFALAFSGLGASAALLAYALYFHK